MRCGRDAVLIGAALQSAAALVAVLSVGCGQVPLERTAEAVPVEVAPLEPYRAPIRAEVAPGDTLESVCRRLAGEAWVEWRDALSSEIDPRRLLPGTAFEGSVGPAGELERLRVVLDLRTELELQRERDGIRIDRVTRKVTSEVVRLAGRIDSSLFAAVEAAGGEPELAVRLAEIFQWDIDFFRDLRTDDEFVVVADRQTVDGAFIGYGTLYAARFVNDGRELYAVAYRGTDGRVGYYDLDGRPLEKQFLRSPLKFSRITSSFSMSRLHPVLGRRMPHYGVDYGAPTGTPVHVTASGTVTLVGRKGGAGNMVTVRHANGYETSYLHLSRYASGVRRGTRVSQGQVVGYVGATGWATGPHLDYRVKLNGGWINPLTISSPPAPPLDESLRDRYLAHALAVLSLLEGREPPAGARC
jgi:murein DD-endopeptidase MepM/ murein hydrolase activator NlpD